MSEHNLIQRPELLRGVQQATGLRQPSLLPTLNTGVQVTLGMDPVNRDPLTAKPESFAALLEIAPDAVNVKRAVFANPITSNRIAVLRRLHVYTAEDIFGPFLSSLVYDVQAMTGGLQFGNLVHGQRLVTGYQGHGGGVNPPTPPQGLDFNFVLSAGARALPQSHMGWMAVPPTGIAGGYIWRGLIKEEVLEDFNPDHGPRMIVFPDGLFETYVIDVNFHGYFNMWWDEYPLNVQ